jgi:hypothetical protein
MAMDRHSEALDTWLSCSFDPQIHGIVCGLPADAFGDEVPLRVEQLCGE